MAHRSKMDEAREWLVRMPVSAMKYIAGAIVGQMIVETFEPEIAMLADWIRALIGLR